jgi:uncharacterized protein YegL
MTGSKIKALNQAVREMIESFKQFETHELHINVSIITFGPVNLFLPYTSANDVTWQDLETVGATPIGGALKMAKAMIECKKTTPSRAYRPAVVLVSDGMPTDDWQQAMSDFVSNGRSAKCDRMAMAIGREAPTQVLNKFVEGTPNPLFEASNAKDLARFFKRVTMSVTTRSASKNPNILTPVKDEDSKQEDLIITAKPSISKESGTKSNSLIEPPATENSTPSVPTKNTSTQTYLIDDDDDDDDSYWG